MTSRHEVICRRGEDFRTLTLSAGEDGWTWGESVFGGFKLQAHTQAAAKRLAGVAPDLLPNLTITRRQVDDVIANPPLVHQSYGGLLDTQPGATLSIYAPVRHGVRDKFERWTRVTRHMGGPDRDIPILACAGLNEVGNTFPFGAVLEQVLEREIVGDNTEIWLRPHWQIAHVEFLPDAFPPEKVIINGRTPEMIERMEADMRARGLSEHMIDKNLGRQSADSKKHDDWARHLMAKRKARGAGPS